MSQDTEKAIAVKYGAEMRPDEYRGHGWSRFVLNGRHIWSAFNVSKWESAQFVGGIYRNHKEHETLTDAMEYAKKNQCETD